MIIYNQAFDLYHTVYRFLQLLNKFDEGVFIEIDRLRILDFYMLFPSKIYEIKLKRSEGHMKKMRKSIENKNNPYEFVFENRKIFERIRPFQLSALKCIASYGIIDKEALLLNRVTIVKESVLNDYVKNLESLHSNENEAISFLTSYFSSMSLYGSDGLKSRTGLMESKYDA